MPFSSVSGLVCGRVTHVQPQSCSSVTAPRAPGGFGCRQPCLRLHCTAPAAFLCISFPAGQKIKWWQVTGWLFACDRAASHMTCLHGQLQHDMLYPAGRGQSAAAPLASLQTAPTPWCSPSLTAEQNEAYFWFIAATCNELHWWGLLTWSTLARAYCLSATDGKTNSIDDGNPFIVLWIQHPPESTTKPLSVSLNTTFYI